MIRQVPNGDSRLASFSANGRKVAFHSRATNLTDTPTNGRSQIYVRDLDSGRIDLVSLSTNGQASNGDAFFASISGDGKKIAFSSESSTLVPGDTNSFSDIYLRDLSTGQTNRVSVSTLGEEGNSASTRPSLSHDGNLLAFASRAKNLVPEDTSYGRDIFVRNLAEGTTERINLGPQGEEANGLSNHPKISGNGRFVVFTSHATNLVPNDTNGLQDVFVRDLKTGENERINLNNDGEEANGKTYEATISDDGRFVAFYSKADNLVEGDTNDSMDVFVRDREWGVTERVSLDHLGQEIAEPSFRAAISGDGSQVGFVSAAPGVVEKDSYGYDEVYVRDLVEQKTERVSVGSQGARTKASSTAPALNTEGNQVVFTSWASNLVDEKTRNRADIYLRDRQASTTERISQKD